MPRYFFDTEIGGQTLKDESGILLRDADAAWERAQALAASLLATQAGDARLLAAVIAVRDAEGEIVLEFPVSEAIRHDGH
ncbi:DUF6894 family protein [Roseixanthobacter pseudopolyaromaticivorans]|uniref:DUF6894 family protein n=1 Tax=Xanthobacteraceae TaxID=335928 RepID=UPI00372BE9D6